MFQRDLRVKISETKGPLLELKMRFDVDMEKTDM